MKYEEMNALSTILIEPTDEKVAVLERVSQQSKPVVVVLSEQTSRIFQHPTDFSELRRVRRQLGTSISLVITSSERQRQWARRHGFPVYTSTEACTKALARRERLRTGLSTTDLTYKRVTRKLPITGPLDTKQGWHCVMDDDDNDEGWPGWEYARMDLSDGMLSSLPPLDRGNTGVIEWGSLWSATDDKSATPFSQQISASGEYASLWSASMPSAQKDDGWPGWAHALKDTDPANTPIGWQPSLDTSGRQLPASGYTPPEIWGEAYTGKLDISKAEILAALEESTPKPSLHTFMFALVVLLLLGILGGIGFGFLLAASHAMPGAFLHASFLG